MISSHRNRRGRGLPAIPLLAGFAAATCASTSFTGYSIEQGNSVSIGDTMYAANPESPQSYPVVVNQDGTLVVNAGGDASRETITYWIWRLATQSFDGPGTIYINELAPIWNSGLFPTGLQFGSVVSVNLAAYPYFTSPEGDALTLSHSGALPTGLSLASNGMLTGTVNSSGSFTFTLTAEDVTQTSTNSPSIVVNVPAVQRNVSATPLLKLYAF